MTLLAVRTLLLPAGLLLLLPALATAEMYPVCQLHRSALETEITDFIFVFDRDIPIEQMNKYKYLVKGMTCELNNHENNRMVVVQKKGMKIDVSPPMSLQEFHSALESITGTKKGKFTCPTKDTLPALSPTIPTRLMIFVNGDVAEDACNFTKLEEYYPPDKISLQQIQLGRFHHDKHIRIHQRWRSIKLQDRQINFDNNFLDMYSYGSLKLQITLWVKNMKPRLLYAKGTLEEDDLSTTQMSEQESTTLDPTLMPVELAETTVTTTEPAESSTPLLTTTITTSTKESAMTEFVGERTVPTVPTTVAEQDTTYVLMAVDQRETETAPTTTSTFPVTSTVFDKLSTDSTTTMTTTVTQETTAVIGSTEGTFKTTHEETETTTGLPPVTDESVSGSRATTERTPRDLLSRLAIEDPMEDGMFPRRRDSGSSVRKSSVAGTESTTIWKDQSTGSTEPLKDMTTGESTSSTTVLLAFIPMETSLELNGHVNTRASTMESTVSVRDESTTVWRDSSIRLTESTEETTTVPSSKTTVPVRTDLSTGRDSTTVAVGIQKVQSTEGTGETTTVTPTKITSTVLTTETTVAVQTDFSTTWDSTTGSESTTTDQVVGFMVMQQRDTVRADRISPKPALEHKKGSVDLETNTRTTTTTTSGKPGPVGLWFRESWIWLFVALIVLLMLCLCIAICIAVVKKSGVERTKREKRYQKAGEELFATAAATTKTAREMPRSHHSSSSKSLESSSSLMAREGEHALLVPKEPEMECTQNALPASAPMPEPSQGPSADAPFPHAEEGAVDPFSPALPSPFEIRNSDVALTPVKTTSSIAQPKRLHPKPSRRPTTPTEKDIFNM